MLYILIHTLCHPLIQYILYTLIYSYTIYTTYILIHTLCHPLPHCSSETILKPELYPLGPEQPLQRKTIWDHTMH